jgi:hypothetical protein
VRAEIAHSGSFDRDQLGGKVSPPLVDFEAIHRDGPRGRDAEADSVTLDRDHGHANVIADHDFLADTPGEN